MRHEPIRRAFRFNLGWGFAERQRFGLSKNIRQEDVVMAPQRGERVPKRYEITGDESGPLVNQLIERVLAIGSGFAPKDRTGVIGDLLALERDVLAVALHGQLLQVSREPFKILLVRQHRNCLSAEEIVVPEGQ